MADEGCCQRPHRGRHISSPQRELWVAGPNRNQAREASEIISQGSVASSKIYLAPLGLQYLVSLYPRFVPPALHTWAIIILFLRNKTKQFVYSKVKADLSRIKKFYIYEF